MEPSTSEQQYLRLRAMLHVSSEIPSWLGYLSIVLALLVLFFFALPPFVRLEGLPEIFATRLPKIGALADFLLFWFVGGALASAVFLALGALFWYCLSIPFRCRGKSAQKQIQKGCH